MQRTASPFKNPRNSMWIWWALEHGFQASCDSGAQALFWQLRASLPLQQFCTIKKREIGREREPKIFQLVSVRTHQFQVMFLQHARHGARRSCQYGEQRSSFDRSCVYIPDSVQQENSMFPLNKLPLPQLGPPAAAWTRPCLCLSYIFTGTSCSRHRRG